MLNSNKLFLLSFLISTSIFISINQSKASEQLLATISTDLNSDTYQLSISINDDQQSLDYFLFDNYSPGIKTGRDSLAITTFVKEGIKLPKKGTYNFAHISGENFDQELGGIINIDVIYNALTRKRKNYELHLAKDKNGWKLFYHGNPISKIQARSNKIPLIGVVGAKELIMK